jgi:uncharacterized DUF497 family protein
MPRHQVSLHDRLAWPYRLGLEIEYDPAKDAANIARRGLPFRLARPLLAGVVGRVEDVRFDYGERRIRAYGIVNGDLLCCVYTIRNGVARVISLRFASRKERRTWLS